MKKLLVLLPMILLLAGCGSQETFETVTDNPMQQVSMVPEAQQVVLELPENTKMQTMQNDGTGKLYFCDNFFITVQTVESGDLDGTLRSCTGFSQSQLRLIRTESQGAKCYECVWASAGEGQEQVGRLCLLDDGNYHYVVTAMADAENAGALQNTWQRLFDSVQLLPADLNLDTAS